MNRLIQAAIESISLEGFLGCTLRTLWYHFKHDHSKNFDDYMKGWLLCQLSKRNDVQFYTISPHAEIMFYKDSFVKGNMQKDRKLVEADIMAKPALELEQFYGDTLVIVASQELRNRALGIGDENTLSDVTYSTLEYIGRSRRQGIPQLDLTKFVPSETPKTIFFHIKKLEMMGLIRRKSTVVNVDKALKTNQIFLTRYLSLEGADSKPTLDDTEALAEEDGKEEIPNKKNLLLLELPVDYQIYKMIESNGPSGVYQKDVAFSNFSYRDTIKRIESITKRGLVISYPENVGRTVTHKIVAKFLGDGSKIDQTDIEKELLTLNESLYQESKSTDKPDKTSENEGIKSEPKTIKKTPRKTIQFVKRKRLLVEELEKKRIIHTSEIKRIFEDDQLNERTEYIENLSENLRDIVNTDVLKKQYVIDKKTINSVVEEILKDGAAKKSTAMIPMSNGTTKSVQFLVAAGVTQEELSDYISSLRDEDISNKGHYLPNRKLKELEDKREPDVIDMMNESVESPPTKDTSYTISLRYGFIKAKMQRARLFHQYLNTYVIKHVEAVEFPFNLTDSVMNMELSIFCQTIGQVTVIEGLEEYKQYKVADLPQTMKLLVLQRRNFMRRVQTVLDILLKLNLISKVISMEMEHDGIQIENPCDYVLKKSANIPDTGNKEYNFQHGVSEYWRDLESFCQQKIISEDEEYINKSSIPKECFNRTNWSGIAQLSKHQNRLLSSALPLMNESAGPYYSGPTPLMVDVSKDARLSPHQVMLWYNNTLSKPKDRKRKKSPFDKSTKSKRAKTGEDLEEESATRAVPNRQSASTVSVIVDKQGIETEETIDLPSSIEEFYKSFSISSDVSSGMPSSHLSSASALYIYDTKETPKHNEVLQDYIISILMIPEGDYKVERAYELFSKFYEQDLIDCFENLKSKGYITKDKVGSRGYQLSRKYKHMAKQVSPDLLKQIEEFVQVTILNYKMDYKNWVFKPIENNGGSVAFLLAEFLNRHISLGIEAPSEPIAMQKLERQKILGRNDKQKQDQDKHVPDTILPLAKVVLNAQVDPHVFVDNFKKISINEDDISKKEQFPWINNDGTINENLLRDLTITVASIVLNAPGISEIQLIKQWNLFRPQVMKYVLQLLEAEEFIRYDTLKIQTPNMNHIINNKNQDSFTNDNLSTDSILEERFIIPYSDIHEKICRMTIQ